MKKRTIFCAVAATMLTLNSCNNDNDVIEKTKYITVDTNIKSLSRVSTPDDNGTQVFETNDKISVYAWAGENLDITKAPIINNVINSYDGNFWIPESQMLWKDMVTPHYFIAVYPQKAITNFSSDEYTLDVANQENSDLLIAVNKGEENVGLKASSAPVSLQFDHVMSKLVVNLLFRNQWGVDESGNTISPSVESVTLTAINGATVNYETAIATPSSDNATISLPSKVANKQYASIMVPQAITSKIVITIDGKEYTYNNENGFNLTKGKITTINLSVGRDGITLSNVNINDWENGEVINGGVAVND